MQSKHKLYIFKNLIFLSFLGLQAFNVEAQQSLTLQQAIVIGLEENFDIKIADRAILIAEQNNTWARAGRVPTIDLTANFNSTFTRDNNPASFLQGTFYNGGLNGGLNVNWLLYGGGRVGIQKDLLDKNVEAAMLSKNEQIQSLIRNIILQYYTVVFEQERMNVISNSAELSNASLEYENARRSYGGSNSFNVLQFQNAILADSINYATQIQRINTAKTQLFRTLQIVPDANIEISDRLSVTPEALDLNKMEARLMDQNATLKTLAARAAISELNVGIAKANQRPIVQLNLGASAAENGFQFFAENPNTGQPFGFIFSNRFQGTGGISASWNLYDGGIRSTDVKNAQLQTISDADRILQATADLKNQLNLLLQNYQQQTDVLKMADRQINLLDTQLEIAEARYRSGQISSIDYRNIQLQYINAGFAKIQAMYNLLVTKNDMDFVMGVF